MIENPICKQCGSMVMDSIPGPHAGGHHAKQVCGKCGAFIQWISKPENEKTKRPASHRELVRKFGNGQAKYQKPRCTRSSATAKRLSWFTIFASLSRKPIRKLRL